MEVLAQDPGGDDSELFCHMRDFSYLASGILIHMHTAYEGGGSDSTISTLSDSKDLFAGCEGDLAVTSVTHWSLGLI